VRIGVSPENSNHPTSQEQDASCRKEAPDYRVAQIDGEPSAFEYDRYDWPEKQTRYDDGISKGLARRPESTGRSCCKGEFISLAILEFHVSNSGEKSISSIP
jgi:hypothetical protein